MEKIMIAWTEAMEEKQHDSIEALKLLGTETFLSLDPADLEKADKLLLTGSKHDINPKLWGEENTGSLYVNDELDAAEWKLLEKAVEMRKPVLGICRGMQFINVYFGGTLIQDLPCKELHQKHNNHRPHHTVRTVEGTFTEKLFGKETTVNSSHHQSVNILGRGLNLCAVWDGEDMSITEAFEHKEYPIIGVQWHPECMLLKSDEEEKANGEKVLRYFLGK